MDMYLLDYYVFIIYVQGCSSGKFTRVNDR
jgi:hypothetical protein